MVINTSMITILILVLSKIEDIILNPMEKNRANQSVEPIAGMNNVNT